MSTQSNGNTGRAQLSTADHERAVQAAYYRLHCSPHEFGDSESQILAEYAVRASAEIHQLREALLPFVTATQQHPGNPVKGLSVYHYHIAWKCFPERTDA